VAERIELTRRPVTVDEVDRWIVRLLEERRKQRAKSTPDSAAEVARCDAAIDQLLQLRLELTGSADDPAGT
jgi:chorismate mutase